MVILNDEFKVTKGNEKFYALFGLNRTQTEVNPYSTLGMANGTQARSRTCWSVCFPRTDASSIIESNTHLGRAATRRASIGAQVLPADEGNPLYRHPIRGARMRYSSTLRDTGGKPIVKLR